MKTNVGPLGVYETPQISMHRFFHLHSVALNFGCRYSTQESETSSSPLFDSTPLTLPGTVCLGEFDMLSDIELNLPGV